MKDYTVTQYINSLITLEQSVITDFMTRYESPVNSLSDAQDKLCRERWRAGEKDRSYFLKLGALRRRTPLASALRKQEREDLRRHREDIRAFLAATGR